METIVNPGLVHMENELYIYIYIYTCISVCPCIITLHVLGIWVQNGGAKILVSFLFIFVK